MYVDYDQVLSSNLDEERREGTRETADTKYEANIGKQRVQDAGERETNISYPNI